MVLESFRPAETARTRVRGRREMPLAIRRRTILVLAVVLAVVASAWPARTQSASGVRTVVFARGKESKFFVTRGWGTDPDGQRGLTWEIHPSDGVSGGIFRTQSGVYYYWAPSLSGGARGPYARPRPGGVWNVSRWFASQRLGLVRKRSPNSWDIYTPRERRIGYASGPDGVAAALNYLFRTP
jgi:hypothetical protein